MPACVAMTISATPVRRRRAHAFHVALEQRGERLIGLSIRDAAARGPSTRCNAETDTWKYIGCSAQSVPSLSNVAMRSARRHEVGRAFLGHLLDKGDDGLLGACRRSTRATDRWPAMVAPYRQRRPGASTRAISLGLTVAWLPLPKVPLRGPARCSVRPGRFVSLHCLLRRRRPLFPFWPACPLERLLDAQRVGALARRDIPSGSSGAPR